MFKKILPTIFLADGAAINTIGTPNANASKNERGHILKKFGIKHSGTLLHIPKYTLKNTITNDIIEDIINTMIT